MKLRKLTAVLLALLSVVLLFAGCLGAEGPDLPSTVPSSEIVSTDPTAAPTTTPKRPHLPTTGRFRRAEATARRTTSRCISTPSDTSRRTISRKKRRRRSAGPAAASKSSRRARVSAAAASATTRDFCPTRRGASTPSAISTRSANRSAGRNGSSFPTTG